MRPSLRELLLRLGHFVSTSDLVVLPKMVIAEAGNFPDLARIYREEVVERGLTLFGGLLQTGMERGEFRKMPVQHAVRLCIAPLLLAAIWRTTFAPSDAAPYDYAGLIEAHVSTLLRGLQAEKARMRRASAALSLLALPRGCVRAGGKHPLARLCRRRSGAGRPAAAGLDHVA